MRFMRFMIIYTIIYNYINYFFNIIIKYYYMLKNIFNKIIINDNKDINNIIKFLIILIIILILCNKLIYAILIIIIIIIINYNSTQYNYNNNNKKICRNSTIDNPYSNILITTDLDKIKINKCNVDEEIIRNNVEYNQYFNSTDLLKNKNNNRVHMSYITKYPNNINKYINFLYNIDKINCK